MVLADDELGGNSGDLGELEGISRDLGELGGTSGIWKSRAGPAGHGRAYTLAQFVNS